MTSRLGRRGGPGTQPGHWPPPWASGSAAHPWLGAQQPRGHVSQARVAAQPSHRRVEWGSGVALSRALHIQINFCIFIRVLLILAAKLRARQMRYTDYKFRWVWLRTDPGRARGGGGDTGAPWAARGLAAEAPTHRLAKSTLTLIPLLGVHEVAFAFVTDEHAQGTLRSAKLFFDLFLSSFQVPPCPLEPPAPPQAWLPP